jgi:hypothetical protein
MDQNRMAWIGAIVGTGIGVVGAAIGIALPFVMKPSGQSLSPEAGRNLAWGFGIGMTVFFAFMCALFGYLLSIRPARGPRERSFAVVSTMWGSLLVAAFPWFLYGLQNADDTTKSAGWMILGVYASIRVLGKWQETQLRIRSEEAVESKAASTDGS